MKIHILSDLHIEFENFNIPDTDADLVVLAGDTNLGKKGISWALENIPDKPVIYVLGNHEYYRHAYPKLLNDVKLLSKGTNVHVLENEEIIIENTRFLGCTLWTDFNLSGNPVMAELSAGEMMNDYRLIRRSPVFSKFSPSDSLSINRSSVFWLKKKLLEKSEKTTVVVTHHAPSRKSIPKSYLNNPVNPAYASRYDELILESDVDLWIHGHIHTPCDYFIGNTRIVCNPKGYPYQFDNGFNPELVIDFLQQAE